MLSCHVCCLVMLSCHVYDMNKMLSTLIEENLQLEVGLLSCDVCCLVMLSAVL